MGIEAECFPAALADAHRPLGAGHHDDDTVPRRPSASLIDGVPVTVTGINKGARA